MDPRRTNALLMLALAAASACGSPSPATEAGHETGPCVEYECLGELVCLSDLCVDLDATPTAGDGDSGDEDGSSDGGPATPPGSVSILVVMDNSGSMGEEQAPFARALGELAEQLTTAGIDWRIGVTTTDMGNPWCGSTSPEAGSLVLSSCRSRADDFTFSGAQQIDAYDEACASACPEQWTDIPIVPTAIDGGTDEAARPWVQNVAGTSNLPAELGLLDAFACLAPQGIDGCGFESQLEAMDRAIHRSGAPEDANAGFLPDDALLAVIVLTDEADCSANPDHWSIFEPDGERVFWADQDAPAPTSAVCWNAGTQCADGQCQSADYDARGNPVASADAATQAVLHPLDRYAETLDGAHSVLLTVIAGVDLDGGVVYDPAYDDEDYLNDFGIGPGCTAPSGRATPPVRMRELVERFSTGGDRNLSSVCDPTYERALDRLSTAIVARVE